MATDKVVPPQAGAVETPLTLRMLKALPADRLDYKPHERSPSAGQIAWTIVRELEVCSALAVGPEVVFPRTQWPTHAEIVREFERLSQVLTERVTRMTRAESFKLTSPRPAPRRERHGSSHRRH